MIVCIVRGSGDVGSAVANILFESGHSVLLHDSPAPAHMRRGMAYVDAFFDGVATLSNVLGKRARDVEDAVPMTRCHRAIPVSAENFHQLLASVRPSIVVDARMQKRRTQARQGGDCLSIGLGPNFTVGENTDIAIETAWGDDLGAVITRGSTKDLEGEPKPIDGVGRERNVYAQRSGNLLTQHRIGQLVKRGDIVAMLDEHPITAPIGGCIRGLTHHGVFVEKGTKIVEIDPRSDPTTCFGIGERQTRIALGVLKALTTA
jgi:xanthine dehydrogenase accessory factor